MIILYFVITSVSVLVLRKKGKEIAPVDKWVSTPPALSSYNGKSPVSRKFFLRYGALSFHFRAHTSEDRTTPNIKENQTFLFSPHLSPTVFPSVH